MKKVTTIGGGTGHSQVLKGLKNIHNIQITGICPSTDSGGSTGVLQKEYDGSSYTGDLTKCIVSLCNDEVLAKALSYRYENGPLHSHSIKNLLFHALEKVENHEKALETMWKICGLGIHKIIPVTKEKTELCARLRLGDTLSGETNIDTIAQNPLWNPNLHSISDIYLKPEVKASKTAEDAIKQSEFIIICPGDLFSSVIPVLLPKGMKSAIQKSKAKIILFLNIMTKRGETDNYKATDFVKNIEKYLGRKADFIIYNNARIPKDVLLKYSLEEKVEMGLSKDLKDPRIISAPLAVVSESDKVFSNPKVIKDILEKIFKK